MITKKRLKNIKENVYMRSEIAKISGLGIDTSLREKLELIEEIDRLNNIINGIEAYCNMAITMNFNMNNSKLQEQIVEDYTNVLDKLKKLKDSD